jgi:hypothetical protein
MSIASGVRKRIDRVFHEKLREPTIVFGPFDAIWPTIGVDHYGWFCKWCGLPSDHLDTLPDARAGARDHDGTHSDVDLRFVEVHLDRAEPARSDPDEAPDDDS